MKQDRAKRFEIFVESVNYIVINYALSNMMLLFRHDALFILFFASEIWLSEKYWKKACGLSCSKAVAWLLLALCFLIHAVILYQTGYISGNLVPFKSG